MMNNTICDDRVIDIEEACVSLIRKANLQPQSGHVYATLREWEDGRERFEEREYETDLIDNYKLIMAVKRVQEVQYRSEWKSINTNFYFELPDRSRLFLPNEILDLGNRKVCLAEHTTDELIMLRDYARVNEGYRIIFANKTANPNIVIALGHNPSAPSPYVTWISQIDAQGRYNYGNGNYCNARSTALEDLGRRTVEHSREAWSTAFGVDNPAKVKPKRDEMER